MGRPVIHWEINARDAKKLSRFYAQLFKWRIDASDPEWAWVDTETDNGIDGSITQVDEGDTTGVTVYIEVNDLEAALAEVEKNGGKIVVPATEMPDGSLLAVFSDPEGNEIGLVEGDDESDDE